MILQGQAAEQVKRGWLKANQSATLAGKEPLLHCSSQQPALRQGCAALADQGIKSNGGALKPHMDGSSNACNVTIDLEFW